MSRNLFLEVLEVRLPAGPAISSVGAFLRPSYLNCRNSGGGAWTATMVSDGPAG